jgi:hypothetical protein
MELMVRQTRGLEAPAALVRAQRHFGEVTVPLINSSIRLTVLAVVVAAAAAQAPLLLLEVQVELVAPTVVVVVEVARLVQLG